MRLPWYRPAPPFIVARELPERAPTNKLHMPSERQPHNNTIADFISGLPVRTNSEELHAVQVFSRILVNDYGYPKSHIRTRPQWRVKARPSDVKKEYPIDITVFTARQHTDHTVHIIVECKAPTRRDGRSQLQDYMRFSQARIGV